MSLWISKLDHVLPRDVESLYLQINFVGQMLLGQALLDLHLGRSWFWTPETRDPTYLKIINRFEDNRKSPFSIHQIAMMGDSEDKRVGEWFGPNTVAQVLR